MPVLLDTDASPTEPDRDVKITRRPPRMPTANSSPPASLPTGLTPDFPVDALQHATSTIALPSRTAREPDRTGAIARIPSRLHTGSSVSAENDISEPVRELTNASLLTVEPPNISTQKPSLLLQLPVELLLDILRLLASSGSMSALAAICRTSHCLNTLALPILFGKTAEEDEINLCNQQNLQAKDYTVPVVFWATQRGNIDTLRRYKKLGRSAHLTSLLRFPANTCECHWPWKTGSVELGSGLATALHFASKFGHSDVVRWLLEQGADVNCPSYYTCQCPSRHLKLLVGCMFHDPADAPSASPLALALAHGQETTARLLIENGAPWCDDHVRNDTVTETGSVGASDGHDVAASPTLMSWRPPQFCTSLSIMAANGMYRLISWLHDTRREELAQAASIYDQHDYNALHYAVCIWPGSSGAPTGCGISRSLVVRDHVRCLKTIEALLKAGFDPDMKVAHRYQEYLEGQLCTNGECHTFTPVECALIWEDDQFAAILRRARKLWFKAEAIESPA